MSNLILLRGGGDLASGVALRLHHVGIRLLITELPQPLLVRRTVAFGAAVFEGEVQVEGVTAHKADSWTEATSMFANGYIPVLVDPDLECLSAAQPLAIIDARMRKAPPETDMDTAPLVIGLGPGFEAGRNCHAVIETMRGHHLGRVFWEGRAAADTGLSGSIAKYNLDRVLRAPATGNVAAKVRIGDRLKEGDLVAEIAGQRLTAPFDGVLRGLIHPSVPVEAGMKIGDLDPRNDPAYVTQVSDKALAIGGGVLEALLARPEIRSQLWTA